MQLVIRQVASEVPARAPEAAPRPTADDPEPCPVAADRPAQRTQGGGLRPRRRPGDIRGAGLPVAAGPFRSPVRIRNPAPPGRRTQHHVRQPTIRSRAPSLPAGLRSELKEEASAQGGGRGTFAEQACRLRRGRPDATGPPKSRALCPRPSTQGNT